MLSQAAGYSMRGRSSYRRLAGGALIVAATVSVLPLLVLAGYLYRVLEYPDAQAPPTLSPLHRNVTHGMYALVSVATLWVPAVGVGIVVLSVASVAGEVWLVVAGTASCVAVVALAYLTPAVVAIHARGEGLVTGYRNGDLRAVVIGSPYAHAVLVSAGLASVLVTIGASVGGVVYALVTAATFGSGTLALSVPELGPIVDLVLVLGTVFVLGVVTFVVLVVSARLVARGVAAAGGDRLPSSSSTTIGRSASAPAKEDGW